MQQQYQQQQPQQRTMRDAVGELGQKMWRGGSGMVNDIARSTGQHWSQQNAKFQQKQQNRDPVSQFLYGARRELSPYHGPGSAFGDAYDFHKAGPGVVNNIGKYGNMALGLFPVAPGSKRVISGTLNQAYTRVPSLVNTFRNYGAEKVFDAGFNAAVDSAPAQAANKKSLTLRDAVIDHAARGMYGP